MFFIKFDESVLKNKVEENKGGDQGGIKVERKKGRRGVGRSRRREGWRKTDDVRGEEEEEQRGGRDSVCSLAGEISSRTMDTIHHPGS